MNVTGYLREKILYINLSGEMDEYSAQSARVKCDKLIEENASVRKIIINLSEVAFMDSTGIGVLIGRYKRLKPRGVPIYIESPPPAVDRVLGLSGIYNIMIKAG